MAGLAARAHGSVVAFAAMNPPRLPPAILIMGPTASGKTAVAMALADRFPVELVSVDSAQVFRDMDVGTAKPLVLSFGLSDGSNGGLASNYVIAEPPTAFASITMSSSLTNIGSGS